MYKETQQEARKRARRIKEIATDWNLWDRDKITVQLACMRQWCILGIELGLGATETACLELPRAGSALTRPASEAIWKGIWALQASDEDLGSGENAETETERAVRKFREGLKKQHWVRKSGQKGGDRVRLIGQQLTHWQPEIQEIWRKAYFVMEGGGDAAAMHHSVHADARLATAMTKDGDYGHRIEKEYFATSVALHGVCLCADGAKVITTLCAKRHRKHAQKRVAEEIWKSMEQAMPVIKTLSEGICATKGFDTNYAERILEKLRKRRIGW